MFFILIYKKTALTKDGFFIKLILAYGHATVPEVRAAFSAVDLPELSTHQY